MLDTTIQCTVPSLEEVLVRLHGPPDLGAGAEIALHLKMPPVDILQSDVPTSVKSAHGVTYGLTVDDDMYSHIQRTPHEHENLASLLFWTLCGCAIVVMCRKDLVKTLTTHHDVSLPTFVLPLDSCTLQAVGEK